MEQLIIYFLYVGSIEKVGQLRGLIHSLNNSYHSLLKTLTIYLYYDIKELSSGMKVYINQSSDAHNVKMFVLINC